MNSPGWQGGSFRRPGALDPRCHPHQRAPYATTSGRSSNRVSPTRTGQFMLSALPGNVPGRLGF